LDISAYKCEIVGPYKRPIVQEDGTDGHPPVLLVKADDEGIANNTFTLYDGAELILKNLINSCISDAGTKAVRVAHSPSGNAVLFDNVLFENYWAQLIVHKSGSFEMKNCVVLNAWGGTNATNRGIGIVARNFEDGAKVSIENNTFVNTAAPLRINGPNFYCDTYYAHNTLINTQNHELDLRQKELIAANNLYHNWAWVGFNTSLYNLNPPPFVDMYLIRANNEWVDTDSVSLYFGHNSFFRDEVIETWFAGMDTLELTMMLPPIATDSFEVADDNWNVDELTIYEGKDPQFTSPPNSNLNSMLGFLQDYWSNPPVTPPTDWLTGTTANWSPTGPVIEAWPLPFDLSYSNADLLTAGSDGLPIGDLNWFPEKKAEYLTNRDQIIADLRAKKSEATTAVNNRRVNTPTDFTLSKAYPNPFNPVTTLEYSLDRAADVKITVFNTLGNEVQTLVKQKSPAGLYKVQWDASDMSSGLYFVVLETNTVKLTRKVSLIK
jgi:hypothetical protein